MTSHKLALTLLIAGLWLSPQWAVAQSGLDGARGMFEKGLYTAAYAAFWPSLTAGDPEAALYALIIRRNGLDGRPPAKPAELSALWNILVSRAEWMRSRLNDPAHSKHLPPATEYAYRTALAQVEYFGPHLSSWPPPPNGLGREKDREIVTHLQKAGQHFTPAMNFMAYLDLAGGGGAGQAFNHTLKAAEKGDHLAALNLIWFYRQGIGTKKMTSEPPTGPAKAPTPARLRAGASTK